MPVLHQLQPSFNNGEISPLLYDRVDFKKFVSSVKSGKNMFVHPQGGMSNRAGTVMLAEAKRDETYTEQKTIPVYAWHIEGYATYYTEKEVPEVGEYAYKNDETTASCEIVQVDSTSVPNTIRVLDGQTATGSVRDSSLDTTKTITETKTRNSGVRLIPFEFSSTETYVIEFGNYYCRFYTANGQVVSDDAPYEIESPFSSDDLANIKYCQSGDVMYIAWGGQPKCLIREGHTNWHFEDYNFKNGPFELGNTDENKHLSVSYDDNENKYIISSDSYEFKQADVGRLIKVKESVTGFHSSGNITSSSGDYVSSIKLVTGNYEFHTTGTWIGTINIEYSKDKTNWKREREFSGNQNFNANYAGSFEEGIFWCRITSKVTSGTLSYTFDSQTVPTDFIFKITNYVSNVKVFADYVGDVGSLSDWFISEGGGGDIIEVIPTMTNNTTPSGEAYSATFGTNAWKFFAQVPNTDGNSLLSNTSGSFGYRPSNACYVNKVYFTILWGSIRLVAVNSLSEVFSNFKIYYSLSGGSSINIPYQETIVDNHVTLDFNGYVLLDNLFFQYTVVTKNNYEAQIRLLKAKGQEYIQGRTKINVTNDYSLGLWANSTFYPSEVELYQDRIVWATNNQLDATKISDYENFGVSTDVTEDDAISVIVKDKKVDRINSIVAGQKLAVYSDDGNFVHNNDTFTPNSATFLKQGATGGADVKPVVVRDNIIYAHPMKQAISDYAYSFETDGYAGQDITLLAHHLFNGKVIKTLAYQQEPYSIIWVLQEEGNVLACTYLRQQDVIAWTPMDFGGEVKSIAVCSTGTEEHLYLAVKRDNGTFVEKMETRLLSMDPKESFFVDCGRTYRGDPATVISGLGYLEGEEVVALADGNVVKDLTVENGSITLPYAASIVTVGLPYESVLETLTFDANTGDGSNLNRKKRVVAVSVRYNNSRGTRISVNGHREVDMLKRGQEGYNIPISLKSGFYREIVASTHNEATTVKIRQDEPLPLTVISVIPEIEYEK